MSDSKQFTLYSHVGGPNGWKVSYVLDELKLTYETKFLNFDKGEQRSPEHTKFNPNGRIPTLIDHSNNDFVLWESDAILLYLVDRYDKDKHLMSADMGEKYQIIQWLFFQSSGQGPYFGQFHWFSARHPEKFPSAIERYRTETLRVFGVLESVLSKNEWLVGNKMTLADLSFIPWNYLALSSMLKDDKDFNFKRDFPATSAWHAKLEAVPTVKKAFEQRAFLLANIL
ncbi:hypothetical protein QCA50_007388 [Cerrena zonata]|uniref:glutathione transferase n=1 Tax=Cerrena zonata TaxID=2478898 RepID=A0AAW0GJE1_9APHY